MEAATHEQSKLEKIAFVESQLMAERSGRSQDDKDTFSEYHRRFIDGEVSPEELEKYDGDWMKALKEKDRLQMKDIINGSGYFMRRIDIAKRNARPFTDMGNAERLVDQYNGYIRFCHPLDQWYVWNPSEGRWKPDKDQYIFRCAKDVVRRIATEAGDSPTDEYRKKGYSWAFVCEARQHINGMVDLSKSDGKIIVSPDDLDKNDFVLNLRNGTLDLKTFELKEHQRRDAITKLTDIEYSDKARCPLWEKYLDRIFYSRKDKKDIIEFLQKAVGYSLTGSTSEQVLFLLYGSGANGKSVFIETLRALLGDYAGVVQSRALTTDRGSIPNDIAGLVGLRCVCASENSMDSVLDESMVKNLTGGDRISARFLHKEFFEFTPRFKLWWSFNHSPNINDMTPSIWRRIRVIPFEESIPEAEQDRDLAIKLRSELPGILRWAIEGLKKYYSEGLRAPSRVKEVTEDYRNDCDVLLDFVDSCCERTDKNTDAVRASDLFETYKIWHSYNGGNNKAMSNTLFGRLLRDKGFTKTRTERGQYYLFVKIKNNSFKQT